MLLFISTERLTARGNDDLQNFTVSNKGIIAPIIYSTLNNVANPPLLNVEFQGGGISLRITKASGRLGRK